MNVVWCLQIVVKPMAQIVYLLHLKENAINLQMKGNVHKDMMDFVFGLPILVYYGISVHKQPHK